MKPSIVFVSIVKHISLIVLTKHHPTGSPNWVSRLHPTNY